MTAPADLLTDADRALLVRPLQGFFTVAAGATPPQPRPVWFELTDDGRVQLFSSPDAVRVARLRRDPRASLVVASPVGEPERWVALAGDVTVDPDGAGELAGRLVARYWDVSDPQRAAQQREYRDGEWVRITLTPTSVRRFTA